MLDYVERGEDAQTVGRFRQLIAHLLAYRASIGRAAIVVTGLVAAGGGAAIAWRADVATPLLITGVALVALGLVGHRVGEVAAKWGNNEFYIKAAVEAEVNARTEPVKRGVDELADDPTTPESVRQELRRIRRELQEGATTRSVPTASEPYIATHSVLPTGDVVLQLRGPARIMLGPAITARCVVTDPSGCTATVEQRMRPAGSATPNEVILRWPDEFQTAAGGPGDHKVDWFIKDPMALAGPGWRPVAMDGFVVT